MKRLKNLKKLKNSGVILLAILFIIPAISLASKTKEIFVDDDAGSKQDGSYDHPYKTISKALKEADGKTKIIVKRGTYIENIVVSKDVKIIGKEAKKVIIKAENKSQATITLENKTEISNLTVEGGKQGVLVKNSGNGETTIVDCLIRNSRGDGIKIEEDGRSSDRKVNIIGNKIYENGKSGIYSQKRKIVIMDNEIFDNELDGIDLEDSIKAHIEDNEINQNDGVGIKLRLGKSDITVSKNSFYKNDKDAIEVRYEGKPGNVIIGKNGFTKNEGFGIVKLYKYSSSNSNFYGLNIEKNNYFSENKSGQISNPIKN